MLGLLCVVNNVLCCPTCFVGCLFHLRRFVAADVVSQKRPTVYLCSVKCSQGSALIKQRSGKFWIMTNRDILVGIKGITIIGMSTICLLYTSDAADE